MSIVSLKAIIFDNDGVVVNSEPLIFKAASEVFARYGIRLLPEDVQEGIGAGVKYMGDPAQKYNLTDVSLEQLVLEREDRFRELAKNNLRPFPGLKPLLDFLKQNHIKTAVASSATHDVVLTNLKMAGIDPGVFDNIVDSSAIQNKKPAPDIFLKAADNLGIQPAECIVIEDSLAGIEAARRAGMCVIAFASSFQKQRLMHADFTVEKFEEILEIIKEVV